MTSNEFFKDEEKVEKVTICDDEEDKIFILYHEIDQKQLNEYANKTKKHPVNKCTCNYIFKSEKRYYQPGIVAKINIRTTDNDLCKLIKHGARTLFLQLAFASPDELEQIMLKINTARENFAMEHNYNTPIGLAVEIKGEAVRTGRMRNNAKQSIEAGQLIVLTTNEDYKFVSVKEIIYVYNLWKYMRYLKRGDVVLMDGGRIMLKIVKIIHKNITLCIEKGSFLNSYMDVILPYCIPATFEASNDYFEDINFAIKNNAHFIVLSCIKSFCWLKGFKKYVESFSVKFEIAGHIPELLLMNNSCEIMEIMDLCDVIWIPNYFERSFTKKRFRISTKIQRLTKVAKTLKKPVVAAIPIETRKDFDALLNHGDLKYIDSMLIEKSKVTNTYPILAKQLQPVPKEYCTGESKPIISSSFKVTPQQGLINCVNYAIHSIPCQGIVISSTLNNKTIIYLSAADIYCPVVAVVPNEFVARSLNVRRNIKTVVYNMKEEAEDEESCRIKHGIDYGRDMKIFLKGDFCLTFFDTIYRGCLAAKFRTIYMPQEKIIVKQNRL